MKTSAYIDVDFCSVQICINRKNNKPSKDDRDGK